jgi:hypothetical protein
VAKKKKTSVKEARRKKQGKRAADLITFAGSQITLQGGKGR